MLSHDEKRELLAVAREAIACALKREIYVPSALPTTGLARTGGAFVTLRIDHALRGCIGYIESEKSLLAVVAEVAPKAALDDPRFPPMTFDEFVRASIEISVLGPLRRISAIEEIHIGLHGLVVALGGRRGLLLPQVAVEQGFDNITFLRATMQKAGLPPSQQLLHDAEVFVFEAEVIHEEDVLERESG